MTTRGFTGRRQSAEVAERIPPGQSLVADFPVLSAGPTPRVEPDEWRFVIRTEAGEQVSWTWDEFLALPIEDVHTDIHCVTRWSKLGTSWRGVSLDTLLDAADTDAGYAMAHSYGGYTTNLAVDELRGGRAWVAFEFEGEPLDPEHGGPARLLVPHLYLWKSAKWVRGLELTLEDEPGFWETYGYHDYGDPWREQRYRGD